MKALTFILSLLFFQASAEENPTIVISIDGFSGEYLHKYNPSFLNQLARSGVSTTSLLPVYPSKTFPNHVSMVTGKSPNEHGIIHNKFFNRVINKKYSLGAGNYDPRWLTADPIWTIAERNGIKTGVYFWPESETRVNNILPTFLKPYRHETPNKVRFEKLAEWLSLPKEQRPQLLFSYISTLDSAGHAHGPTGVDTIEAVNEVDNLIRYLFKIIKSNTELTPNVIIVSDHGMVSIDKNKVINVNKLFSTYSSLNVVNGQTQLFIYEDDPNKLIDVRSHLLKQPNKHLFTVYTKGNYPSHWNFQKETAVLPDMIIAANHPATFENGDSSYAEGTHGYDAQNLPQLHGVFIAYGPDFNVGTKILKLDNRYVFNIISRLIGVKQSNDDEKLNKLIFK